MMKWICGFTGLAGSVLIIAGVLLTRNKAVAGNLLSEIYYPILFLCVLLGVSVCIQR